MSYLVKNGTDVNQTDHRGMTALDTAAMRGNAAVAAELLLIPGVYIEVNLILGVAKFLRLDFGRLPTQHSRRGINLEPLNFAKQSRNNS